MTVVGALKWSDTSIVSRRSIFSHASTTTFSRITIGPRRRGEEDSRRQKRKTSLSLYISFLETSTKRRSTVTGRALSGEFRWKTPGQAIVGGGRKRRGGDWIVKWLVVTLICAMRNVETNRTSSSLRRSLSRGSVLMIRKRIVASKRFYRRSRSRWAGGNSGWTGDRGKEHTFERACLSFDSCSMYTGDHWRVR